MPNPFKKGEKSQLIPKKNTVSKWSPDEQFESLEAGIERINIIFTNSIKLMKDKNPKLGIYNKNFFELAEKAENNPAAQLWILAATTWDSTINQKDLKKQISAEFKKEYKKDKPFLYIIDLLKALIAAQNKSQLKEESSLQEQSQPKEMLQFTEKMKKTFDDLSWFLAQYIQRGNEDYFSKKEGESNISIKEYMKQFSTTALSKSDQDKVLTFLLTLPKKDFAVSATIQKLSLEGGLGLN